MRRYTLIYHDYIGYGSYYISFRRVRCAPSQLEKYKKDNLHFIVPGWPPITHPDGEPVEYRKGR